MMMRRMMITGNSGRMIIGGMMMRMALWTRMARIVRGIKIGRKMQRKMRITRNGGRMTGGIMRMTRGIRMQMMMQMKLQMNNLTVTKLSTSELIITSKPKPRKTNRSNPTPKLPLKLTGSRKELQPTSSSKENVEAAGPTALLRLSNLTC